MNVRTRNARFFKTNQKFKFDEKKILKSVQNNKRKTHLMA